MKRAVLAITLPVILGGCTTLYPPLYSAPTVAAAIPYKDDDLVERCKDKDDALAQTLACAEILQAVYSAGYQKSAQMQDISQLPIIGAAAAAAWILLKDKEHAARRAGKIGIGALTYSAARDQLLPSGLPDTFIKGHAALGCVIAQGGYFDRTVASDLETEVANVFQLRVAVQKLRYLDPKPGDKSATPEMLKAARSLADEAITLSAAQLEASQTQLGAFQFANVTFHKTVTNVAAWVASRGRTRPNLSYDTLLGTFKPKAAAAGVRNADPASPVRFTTDPGESRLLDDSEDTSWTGAELVERLATASSILSNAAIRLKGSTPDYRGRLEAVGKCATDLPTG